MNNYNEYTKIKDRVVSYLCSEKIISDGQDLFVLPTSLFRYSRVNEYIIENLETGTITLTNPALFNDLYDGILHRNSFEELYEYEKKRCNLMQMMGFSNSSFIDIEMLQMKAEHDDKLISQIMRERFKVGCLSQNNKSILMWSHYADKNQGICIEYDLKDWELCSFIYPVIYVSNPIDTSKLCNTNLSEFNVDLAVLLSIITKNDVWRYEEEWRIVYPFIGEKNTEKRKRIDKAMPKPKAIYLGKNFLQCWIQEKNNNKNMELFNRLCKYFRDNKIPLYVMKNRLMSYELYPKLIDVDYIQQLDENKLYDEYLL